jgi:hypothetical protein
VSGVAPDRNLVKEEDKLMAVVAMSVAGDCISRLLIFLGDDRCFRNDEDGEFLSFSVITLVARLLFAVDGFSKLLIFRSPLVKDIDVVGDDISRLDLLDGDFDEDCGDDSLNEDDDES